MKAFAVRDVKVSGWLTPHFNQHLGLELRGWQEVVNDAKSDIAKYPEDFSLYEVGAWDSEQGMLIPLSPPKLVATASEYVKKSDLDSDRLKVVQ